MTLVLVHGGGFSGSCWDELEPLLTGTVIAVDLPGRGRTPKDLGSVTISDFVGSVTSEIVARDLTDVTLVGHSMAGVTLPGVAERIPDRISHLVFVSCAVPPDGTPLADVLGDLSPAVQQVAARIGDDVVDSQGALHADLARAMFCNDMDEPTAESTLARRVPETLKVLSEPTDLTGLRHPIPRTYVRLTRDASITLDAQNMMIANLGEVGVVDLDAGHMAMISDPQGLAAILNGF
jgi:pimeloyl-ACP methyl ester carboxylesterase